MKILMITQKVDKSDGVLGIYHEWIKKISENVSEVKVICLYKGEVDLPRNVSVYSLGKERGGNKLSYVFNFYRILFTIGFDYKTVLVHMNPEYLLLAGFIWRLLNKKVVFWYNHSKGGVKARLGFFVSNVVLATSPNSMAFRKSGKTVLMPVGVNVEENISLDDKDFKKLNILYLGRISPVKNVDVLIGLGNLLKENNYDFKLTIVGSPVDREGDVRYFEKIKKDAENFNIMENIKFVPSVPHDEVADFYRDNNFFINVTDKGSMDKTIFEAMAYGCLVLTSNIDMSPPLLPDLVDFMRVDIKEESLYRAFVKFIELDEEKRKNLVKMQSKYVRDNHSLEILVSRLVKVLGV